MVNLPLLGDLRYFVYLQNENVYAVAADNIYYKEERIMFTIYLKTVNNCYETYFSEKLFPLIFNFHKISRLCHWSSEALYQPHPRVLKKYVDRKTYSLPSTKPASPQHNSLPSTNWTAQTNLSNKYTILYIFFLFCLYYFLYYIINII